jgi:hypothetical protein
MFEKRGVEVVDEVVGRKEMWEAIYAVGVVVVRKGGSGFVEWMRMIGSAEARIGVVGVGSICLGLWIHVATVWECDALKVYCENLKAERGDGFCDFANGEKVKAGVFKSPVDINEVSRIIGECEGNEAIKKVIESVPDFVEVITKPWVKDVPNEELKRAVNSVMSLNAFSGVGERRPSCIVDPPSSVHLHSYNQADEKVSGVADLRSVLLGGDEGGEENGESDPGAVNDLLKGLDEFDGLGEVVVEGGAGADVPSYTNQILNNL